MVGTPHWGEVEGLLREGREWIKNSMQPCLQETSLGSWGGKTSWYLLEESGLREMVIKISNVKAVLQGGDET
jgi:hypothetical protein